MDQSSGSSAKALFAGIMIGAAATMVLSPAARKETRRRMARMAAIAGDTASTASEKVSEVSDKLHATINDKAAKVAESSERASNAAASRGGK